MFLDISREGDVAKINRYGKAKGMALLYKYLPHINIFESLYIVDSINDVEKLIAKDFNRMICVRADSQIGQKPTFVAGQTLYDKNQIRDYFKEIKQNNADGALICADMKDGSGERIKTDGGFNIHFDIGMKLYIDYVGKGFDSRECSKGKASHEIFMIPWNEVPFLEAKLLNKYRVQVISDEAYKKTSEERKNFLIDSGYDKKTVIETMPRSYQPLSLAWKKKILDEIIFPLLDRQEELVREGLGSFGIQGNFVGDSITPIEMNRPERF